MASNAQVTATVAITPHGSGDGGRALPSELLTSGATAGASLDGGCPASVADAHRSELSNGAHLAATASTVDSAMPVHTYAGVAGGAGLADPELEAFLSAPLPAWLWESGAPVWVSLAAAAVQHVRGIDRSAAAVYVRARDRGGRHVIAFATADAYVRWLAADQRRTDAAVQRPALDASYLPSSALRGKLLGIRLRASDEDRLSDVAAISAALTAEFNTPVLCVQRVAQRVAIATLLVTSNTTIPAAARVAGLLWELAEQLPAGVSVTPVYVSGPVAWQMRAAVEFGAYLRAEWPRIITGRPPPAARVVYRGSGATAQRVVCLSVFGGDDLANIVVDYINARSFMGQQLVASRTGPAVRDAPAVQSGTNKAAAPSAPVGPARPAANAVPVAKPAAKAVASAMLGARPRAGGRRRVSNTKAPSTPTAARAQPVSASSASAACADAAAPSAPVSVAAEKTVGGTSTPSGAAEQPAGGSSVAAAASTTADAVPSRPTGVQPAAEAGHRDQQHTAKPAAAPSPHSTRGALNSRARRRERRAAARAQGEKTQPAGAPEVAAARDRDASDSASVSGPELAAQSDSDGERNWRRAAYSRRRRLDSSSPVESAKRVNLQRADSPAALE